MKIEDLFSREAVLDLSFFNFRNAITACYFADRKLRVLRVNNNFRAFFPTFDHLAEAHFPAVLAQIGVDPVFINAFSEQLEREGRVHIPAIPLSIGGEERVYSLMSTYTSDEDFPYLNGLQGQFVDRTAEWALRREHDRLLEEKLRDRALIEDKTRELERVANRLAKYLSPQIYASIFTGKGGSGETLARKNLTVFFSDIQGFTDISDAMEPERLAFFINTYLSEMSEIAIQYGGTIDKFIGDAIVVFFGDPETAGDREDAMRCALMALRMRERVEELGATWREHGISQPLRIRMGITTGFCTVGNFGSEQRVEYTVLGSPVNLAARLQTIAEPNTILISGSTYSLLEQFIECEPMRDVQLKGFARRVDCYRLDAVKPSQRDWGPMTRVGRHVAVNIPDSRRIREAIQELRRIEDELERQLPPTNDITAY